MNFRKFLLSVFGALQVTSNSVLPSMAAPVLPQGDHVNRNPPPEEIITPTEEKCAVVIVREIPEVSGIKNEKITHATFMTETIKETAYENNELNIYVTLTHENDVSFEEESKIVANNPHTPIVLNMSNGWQRTIPDIQDDFYTVDRKASSGELSVEEAKKWGSLRDRLEKKYGKNLQNFRFDNRNDPEAIELQSFDENWAQRRNNLNLLLQDPHVSGNMSAGNGIHETGNSDGVTSWNNNAVGVPELTVVGVTGEDPRRLNNAAGSEFPFPADNRVVLVSPIYRGIDPNVYQNDKGDYYLMVDYNGNGVPSTPLYIHEKEAELIQEFTGKNIWDLKDSQKFITRHEFASIERNRSLPQDKSDQWIALATNGAVVETDTPGVVFALYQTASGDIGKVFFVVNEQGTLSLDPKTYGLGYDASTSTATAIRSAREAVEACYSRADNNRLLQQQTEKLNKQALEFYNSLKDNIK